jgi:hypothetical protein
MIGNYILTGRWGAERLNGEERGSTDDISNDVPNGFLEASTNGIYTSYGIIW